MCIHWAALGQNDMTSPGRAGCCFLVEISLLSSAGRCRTGVLRPSTDVLWWSSVEDTYKLSSPNLPTPNSKVQASNKKRQIQKGKGEFGLWAVSKILWATFHHHHPQL